MPKQLFNLPSSLTSNPTVTIWHDSDSGVVTAELSPQEIAELHRRLPLQTQLHDYELTPSTQLLNVLAKSVEYENARELNAVAITEASNPLLLAEDPEFDRWDLHLAFYHSLFPILDALADLEMMINRFEAEFNNLNLALQSYETKVSDIFYNLLDEDKIIAFIGSNEKKQKRYIKNIEAFQAHIVEDLKRFRENIKTYNQPENKQALLSNHIIKSGITPLGLFVVEQVERANTALAQYRRIDEHFSGQEDYIEKSSDCQKIDVLGDDILAFKKSFAGIRFSTAKPIPEETIRVLRIAGGNFSALQEAKYLVTLNDFIKTSEQADLNAWERLLCHIAGERPHTVGYASICQGLFFVTAIIVATLLEVAAIIFLRFSASIGVGFVAAIGEIFLDLGKFVQFLSEDTREIYKEAIQQSLDRADKQLNDMHNAFSSSFLGLTYLRRQRDTLQKEHHKKKLAFTNTPARVFLLHAITDQTKSSFAYIVAENFTASFVNRRIVKGYQSFMNFFWEPWVHTPSYLSAKIYHFLRETIGYSSEQAIQYSELLGILINDIACKLKATGHSESEIFSINNLKKISGFETTETEYTTLLSTDSNVVIVADDMTLPSFSSIKPNKVGPAESMMDFLEMLCLEFASLINGIFIKLPFASTISLAFSLIAFGVAYLNMGGPLVLILNELSKSFTGEEAISDMRAMLAAFLLWKLATFSIEAIVAIFKIDPHFLEKLYGDPERLFLAFSTFVGLGIALQFSPLIPEAINLFSSSIMSALFSFSPQIMKDFINAGLSMYPAMANVFIIEARVAWEGQLPLNLLEYFFLGLKATFLFGAIFSGYHKPNLQLDKTRLASVIAELNSLSVKEAELTQDLPKASRCIVQLFDALGMPLKRDHAQHIFDLLSAHKVDPELLNDLYNQSIYRGSNNFLQILFLIPGIFITYPYRIVTYMAASLLNAPVIQYGIRKNFSEDATMFIQVLAAISETGRTFLLGMNQLVKSIGALLVALPLYCLGCDFQSFNQDQFSYINMHNNILLIPRTLLTPLILLYVYLFKALNYVLKGCEPQAWKESAPSIKSTYGMWSHMANTNISSDHAEHSKESSSVLLSAHNAITEDSNSGESEITACCSRFFKSVTEICKKGDAPTNQA